MNYLTYFMHLIAFTSPDGSKLDFGDYCAGVLMWIFIITVIAFVGVGIDKWGQL